MSSVNTNLQLQHNKLSDFRHAFRDIRNSFRETRLWLNLAWRDIVVQYERTLIGPFWMTLQAVAWIGALVFIFGGILGPYKEYAVYVSIGIVLYNFITVIMTDSSDVFIKNRLVIHSHPIPYFSFVLRQVIVGIIQLGFQSLVIAAVLLITRYPLDATALLAIPGLLLGIIMGGSIALLFSLLGLRIGDFRFGMLAIMRLGLFITPIIWSVETGGWLKHLTARVNPMAHFINLVRMPIMGQVPPTESYIVALGCIVVVTAAGLYLFAKLRRSIPMWL